MGSSGGSLGAALGAAWGQLRGQLGGSLGAAWGQTQLRFPRQLRFPHSMHFPGSSVISHGGCFSSLPGVGTRSPARHPARSHSRPSWPEAARPLAASPSLLAEAGGDGTWAPFPGGLSSAGSSGPGCRGSVSGDITSHPPPPASSLGAAAELEPGAGGHPETLTASSEGPPGDKRRHFGRARALRWRLLPRVPTVGSALLRPATDARAQGGGGGGSGMHLPRGPELSAQGHPSLALAPGSPASIPPHQAASASQK